MTHFAVGETERKVFREAERAWEGGKPIQTQNKFFQFFLYDFTKRSEGDE